MQRAAGCLAICLMPAFAAEEPPRVAMRSPSQFRELPPRVVKELERRHCTVPQPHPATGGTNVIRGAFARAGQADWAVMCSVNGASSILVFWAGGGVAEIGPRA